MTYVAWASAEIGKDRNPVKDTVLKKSTTEDKLPALEDEACSSCTFGSNSEIVSRITSKGNLFASQHGSQLDI